MMNSRLLRILAAILFVLAGLVAGGVIHELDATMLALFAFALWVGADAV